MIEPEPWLRGPIEGVPLFVMPLFFSFQQVREDLARFTAGLSDEQVWESLGGTSLGFHLKHIAGSVDRLTTYLMKGELTPSQLDVLQQEHVPDRSLPELLQNINESLARAESEFRTVDTSQMLFPRWIGRKRLPSTVLGLLVHIAEHTQRHLGQAIVITKSLRLSP